MPLFSSQLQLNSAASASGTPLADVASIKGAFKVYETYSELTNTPVSLCSNKQIVWVDELASAFQATVTFADYISTFEDTVTWSEFSGFGGSGGSSGDITAVLTANGSGLSGGVTTGIANLSVVVGNGITKTNNAVTLNTGSFHFTDGVEKVVVITTIDGGNI